MSRMRRGFRWRCLFVMIAWVGFASGVAQAKDANWRDGRKIFRKCESCHTFKAEVHRFGPSLSGVFGREAGRAPGYTYSSAMIAAQVDGLRWSEKALDEFLTKPARYLKGTRMQFSGLKNAADRANVIAYVKRRSSRRKK